MSKKREKFFLKIMLALTLVLILLGLWQKAKIPYADELEPDDTAMELVTEEIETTEVTEITTEASTEVTTEDTTETEVTIIYSEIGGIMGTLLGDTVDTNYTFNLTDGGSHFIYGILK